MTLSEVQSWHYTAQLLGKRVIDILGAGLDFFQSYHAGNCSAHPPGLGRTYFVSPAKVRRGGKPFLVCKFRTMEVNAEQRLKELEQLNESQGECSSR